METNQQSQSPEGTPDIRGIDLRIDGSIDKICEVSNSTSNNTRSLWYVIVIVSTLSFAEFWNTHPFNYSTQRLDYYASLVAKDHHRLENLEKFKQIPDSVTKEAEIQLQYDLAKQLFDLFYSNDVDNIKTVRIPILGNTFDISDLGLFAGFSFIVLLLMLKFFLIRKVSNLRIALNAITKRYTEDSDEKLFEDYINHHPDKMKALEQINLNRRKYHYDFLSMKEIFGTYEDIRSARSYYDRGIGWSTKRIFYIPLAVSVLLLLNDIINTCINGWGYDTYNHIFLMFLSIIYIYIIYTISKRCTRKETQIEDMYFDFMRNNYKYVPGNSASGI